MNYVKFDLHCHTKEGSTDAKQSIFDHVTALKKLGYGGLLVTDHDSYKGYEEYKKQHREDDFVVLRGIEYDTCDYGHFIVVVPNHVPKALYELLSQRGMRLKHLVEYVHGFNGILGPAHPYGELFMSFGNTQPWNYFEKHQLLKQFDFLEGYNACESDEKNRNARRLAKHFELPLTAGTDAHSGDYLGKACTYLPDTIKTEENFIDFYKSGQYPKVWGERYGRTTKDRIGRFNLYLAVSFYIYNKVGALLHLPKRVRLFHMLQKNFIKENRR